MGVRRVVGVEAFDDHHDAATGRTRIGQRGLLNVFLWCGFDKRVLIRRHGEESAEKNPDPLSSPNKEEKSGQKKVSLVGAAYTVDPYKRTPEEVLKALFRDSKKPSEPPPSRPKPLFKRIRASLLRDAADTSKPSYCRDSSKPLMSAPTPQCVTL